VRKQLKYQEQLKILAMKMMIILRSTVEDFHDSIPPEHWVLGFISY
jgi:hypothetical protein